LKEARKTKMKRANPKDAVVRSLFDQLDHLSEEEEDKIEKKEEEGGQLRL